MDLSDAALVEEVHSVSTLAFAVLMVAADEASFITGANISVDGGFTAV